MRSVPSLLLALWPMFVSVALIPVHAGEAVLQDLYGDQLPPGAIARMGTIRFHQGDQIHCVAFSPDGKLIAAGNFGLTREVVLWEAATGRERATIAWEGSSARSVAFSPDGKSLAIGDQQGLVRIWDVDSVRELMVLRGEEGMIYSVAFSPDGTRVLSGSHGKSSSLPVVGRGQPSPESHGVVCLWDLATRNIVLKLTGHTGSVLSVAYAPDGKTIASCSDDKTARLWDAETGRQLFKFEEQAPICSIAFSGDGTAVVYGTGDFICLRNPTNGEEVWRKPGTFRLISLAFSPDSKRLALCGHFPPARIWYAKTGDEIHLLQGHRDRVYGVAFSPDGRTLASCSDDGTVRLWKTGSGEPVTFGEGNETTISSLAFSPDGKTLLTGGGQDPTVRLWDVPTGKQLRKMEGHERDVSGAAFSPDGKLLFSGGIDRNVCIWDSASGKLLRQMKDASCQRALVVSPDGKLLALAVGYEIGVWDVSMGEKIRSLKGHESYVLALAFSPDGKTLVSGGQDNTIRLWDVDSGVQRGQVPAGDAVFSLAFSPDGKWIAAGLFVVVRIFEAETGNEVLHSESRYHSGIQSVAFSPDGKTVAAPFGLMDVSTGKTILPLKENGSRIARLTFSPDGKSLATAMTDSTVLIWDLAALEKLHSEGR